MEVLLSLSEKILILRRRFMARGESLEETIGIKRQTIMNYINGKIGKIQSDNRLALMNASDGWIVELDFVSAPSLGGTGDASDSEHAAERVEKKRRGRPKGALGKPKPNHFFPRDQVPVVAKAETAVSPASDVMW